MSETNKKTTPTKDPKARINELLEMGKQKGVLSYKEIMDALQELELDQEAVEKLYEAIEEQNIDVVEEVEVPEDINEEIAEVETILSVTEGINIDDPVRMYLKEIGKVPLLTPRRRWRSPPAWRTATRRPSTSWPRPICVWWCPSPSGTWAGACCSWT